MKYLLNLIFLVTIFSGLDNIKAEEVQRVTFISEIELKNFPFLWQKMISWPSNNQLATSQKTFNEQSIQYAKKLSLAWIKIMLKKKWHPSTSIEFYPLKDYISIDEQFKNADITIMRYKVANYEIQVTQTSWCILFAIKDIKNKKQALNNNITIAREYVSNLLDNLVNNSEIIKQHSMSKVNHKIKAKGWLTGKPKNFNVNDWSKCVSWATDGNTIFLLTGKYRKDQSWSTSFKEEWYIVKDITPTAKDPKKKIKNQQLTLTAKIFTFPRHTILPLQIPKN